MDMFLLQACLFPHQVRHFLQSLGRKIVAVVLAIPLLLGMGLGLGRQRAINAPPSSQSPATQLWTQWLTNLVHMPPPPRVHGEVPPPEAVNRRGQWLEFRTYSGGDGLEIIVGKREDARENTTSTLLPDVNLTELESQLSYPYQTLLPDFSAHFPKQVGTEINLL